MVLSLLVVRNRHAVAKPLVILRFEARWSAAAASRSLRCEACLLRAGLRARLRC